MSGRFPLLEIFLIPLLGCFAQPWPPAWRGPVGAAGDLHRARPPGVPPPVPLSRSLPLRPPAVKVECEPHQVVVTVHRDLFGTGKLVAPSDLTLGGTPPCLPTSLDEAANAIVFEAGLRECESSLQMTPEFLIYRTILFYKPSLTAKPVVVRSNAAEIPIECRYPRKDNVSSRAMEPTWVPFQATVSAEAKLGFSLRLMTDDWSDQRRSTHFQLGHLIHLQADVQAENHLPLRLYVDSCVAMVSPENPSAPQYAIVDSHGCLVDGRPAGVSSSFLSPRPRQEVLRFTVDAFRFAGDWNHLIYITCHLKVTPTEYVPDATNKACSFSRTSGAWLPVEGSRTICSCCEMRTCGGRILGEQQQEFGSPRSWSWEMSGQRSLTVETDSHDAFLGLGPIAVFDSLEHGRQVPGDSAEEEEMSMEEHFPPVIESRAEATGPLFPFRDQERLANVSKDQKDKPAVPVGTYVKGGPVFIGRTEEGSGLGEQADAPAAEKSPPLKFKAGLASRSLKEDATPSTPEKLLVEAVDLAPKDPEQQSGATVTTSVLVAVIIVISSLSLGVLLLIRRRRRRIQPVPCPRALSTQL